MAKRTSLATDESAVEETPTLAETPTPAEEPSLDALKAAFLQARAGDGERTELKVGDDAAFAALDPLCIAYRTAAAKSWRAFDENVYLDGVTGIRAMPPIVVELGERIANYKELSYGRLQLPLEGSNQTFTLEAIKSADVRQKLVADGNDILATIEACREAGRARLRRIALRTSDYQTAVDYWLNNKITAPLLVAVIRIDGDPDSSNLPELMSVYASRAYRHVTSHDANAPRALQTTDREHWLPILRAMVAERFPV